MKRALLVALLVTFMICGNSAAASASTFSARIERDRIHVRISSSLSQNITSLFEKRITTSGDSLTNVTRLFEKEIKVRSPEAYVKDFSIRCTFTNSTIEVAVQFDVCGVISRREEVVAANLTWRAFNILDDLTAENVSYNHVGKAYFLTAIPRYENMTGTRFYENRTLPVTAYRAKDIAGNITMLRFKALETPLSKWQMVYNITRVETSFKFRLGRTVDLAARREFDASVTEFGVWMDLTGEITTSGYARLKGEAVVSEVGVGISQILMFTAVAVPLLIATTSHIIEKKRTRIEAGGRRK